MYRREGLHYKLLLAALDVLVVCAAFASAFGLRFGAPSLFPFEHVPGAADSLVIVLIAALSFVTVFRARGRYALRQSRGGFVETADNVAAVLLAFVTVVALAYFFADFRYSRLTLGFFGLFALLGFVLLRPRTEALARAFVERRVPPRRVAVLGDGHLAAKVASALLGHPELGVELVGFLGRASSITLPAPILGPYDDIHDVIVRERLDEVIFAVPLAEHPHLPELLALASREAVSIKVVPDLYRYVTLSGGVEEFAGLPIIRLQGTAMTPFDRFLKRAFDVVGALALLLFVAPLGLVITALIKLGSRGPLFYAQERMGIDGHVFRMLKFRTMAPDAERLTGEVWAAQDDPRSTRVGRLLRRYSLDELPQLWNVLRGDMSLVGPRPERPVFIEQFRASVPRYHLRHMVKAGITGWAQVNGWRGQTSLEKRIEHDLYYIEHWSFGLDLKILFRTLAGGFWDRGRKHG